MSGIWQGLNNQPTFNTSTMLLLTDGRVMVQEEATPHWHALTPDASGNYVNGTWSMLADMRIWRRYYASGILRDGRVIIIGGEQSGAGGDTNWGEIYDPVSDSWSAIPAPAWATVGDAACCVLPEGKLMIGALDTPECAIFDPETNTWSAAASKAVRSNEESWILLPDESIVTAQCWEPYRSERYGIASNAWKDEGKPPVQLVDPIMHEIGPAMLLYDGKVIWFGAANVHGHGKTALYTPPATYTGTGSWSIGPDIPNVGKTTVVSNDCPATLMPNGKVLFAGAPYKSNDWGAPIYLFEYDPFTNAITQAPTPPNNGMQLYWSRMMLLPSGQVLFGPSVNNLQCYTPDGGPQEAWRPVIQEIVPHCTNAGIDSYLLSGTQLNGLSQATTYGDDCNPATNYPLVRVRNVKTGQVQFCRTYEFSTRAVATGSILESVRFDTRNLSYGDFQLSVIANGISSHSVSFCHRRAQRPCCEADKKHSGECGCGACSLCCTDEPPMDSQVTRLQSELKALERGFQRLSIRGSEKPPARQGKETRKVTAAERKAAESMAADEAEPKKPKR